MARRFLPFSLLSNVGSLKSDPGLSCVNNIQSESGEATCKVGNYGGNYRKLLGVRQNLSERKERRLGKKEPILTSHQKLDIGFQCISITICSSSDVCAKRGLILFRGILAQRLMIGFLFQHWFFPLFPFFDLINRKSTAVIFS